MKKALILLLLIICVILTACASPIKEALKLKEQADAHYNNHELRSAIAVYEKSLEINEDPDTRTSYQKAVDEMNSVDKAKDIIRNLQESQTKLLQSSNDKGIADVVKDIELSFNQLKKIGSPASTTINNYIKTLNNNSFYKSFEMNTTLTLTSLQFGSGNADVYNYSEMLLEVLDKASFLDIYK